MTDETRIVDVMVIRHDGHTATMRSISAAQLREIGSRYDSWESASLEIRRLLGEAQERSDSQAV